MTGCRNLDFSLLNLERTTLTFLNIFSRLLQIPSNSHNPQLSHQEGQSALTVSRGRPLALAQRLVNVRLRMATW